jgi:hypothetical protein
MAKFTVKCNEREVLAELAKLSAKIDQLEVKLMSALSDLQAKVAAEDTVVDSAITLLQGLKTALDAAIAAGNTDALVALSADIDAKTQALAGAVAANTPAAG